MANLSQLLELSRASDQLTFQATVDTGFEALAAKECLDKFGPDINVCYERGRIYVNVPISEYHLVKNLRSVNNLLLVVDELKEINLLSVADNDMAKDLATIADLANTINWKKHLDAWKHMVDFNGNLYPTREQYLEAVSKLEKKPPPGDQRKPDEEMNGIDQETEFKKEFKTDVIQYRVTCYRSGKHSFGSQDAARSFGGRLQDMFQWIVDLDHFQLEIIIHIKQKNVIVLIALTESSLHRRNLSHFGLTTLRSTISFNLLQVAEPKVGEIIIDPFCGSGSIPMEGAIGFPGTYHICGDIQRKSITLTASNKSTYATDYHQNLPIDPIRWDVCDLPLRNSCVDIVVTDLPFGRRVGTKANNKSLYCGALQELARVVRPSIGRVVLLTSDRRAFNISMHQNKKYFRHVKTLGVKLGGIKACVYCLFRTDCDY